MKTCCFTGHRTIDPAHMSRMQRLLEGQIAACVRQDICFFGAGGALGFDMLASETVLSMRDRYPTIRLILVLPCRNHTCRWPLAEKRRFARIAAKADKIVYTAHAYSPGCMQQRNRHLARHSDMCICYLTHAPSGTQYTVDCCKERNMPIVNIATLI